MFRTPDLTDLPGSSAAASAATHTCERHDDVVAERFCMSCGVPLCGACGRMKAHKSCTACSTKAGRPASAVDIGWYVHLFADSLIASAKVVRGRILPVTAGLTVLVTLLVVGVGGFVYDLGQGEDAAFEVGFAAFLAFFAAGCLAAWLQPGFELKTEPPVSPALRMRRAINAGVAPFAILCGVTLVGTGASAALMATEHPAGIVVGTLAMVGVYGAVGVALLPALLPLQASRALRDRGFFASLRLFAKAGPLAWLMICGLHFMLMMSVYSMAYALMFPLAMVAVFAPVLGSLLLIGVSILVLTVTLLLQAAYGVSALRYLEDRARAR
jgi:hypothetical protein